MKKRKMNIVYQRSDLTGTVDKTICPVKLVVFKGELYFLCTTPQWDYYIKLSRILTAAITDETFTLPADRRRRIEERLSASFGIFDEVEPDIKKIVVKFPARPYYKLIFTERRFHDSQKITLDKNGNVMLTMRVPVGLDLINWVLSWPEAIVVEPPELMEKLLEIGMELIGKYEKNA